MKRILCYGDSNTWGYAPVSTIRFNENTRWTGVLQHTLGNKYQIIEEGLNGRTTVHNDKNRPCRSGADLLPVLMESHAPLDIVVIMLGTNDLKTKYNSTSLQVSNNIKSLCQMAWRCEYNHKILIVLISPSHIVNTNKENSIEFAGAVEKSRELSLHYKKVAKDLNMCFVNASQIVETTDDDGIHWTAHQHRKFGLRLAKTIKNIV
jgi:lysophospholipase L1-like esterase